MARPTVLKSTPNGRFFEKLFMAILFPLRVFARNLLRGNSRRNTFNIFFFWCLVWGSNPGSSSNKPTHYLLDHGDFIKPTTNLQMALTKPSSRPVLILSLVGYRHLETQQHDPFPQLFCSSAQTHPLMKP